MFKHTQNISYLETSRRMAAYFLNTLPDDGIVPWYVTSRFDFSSLSSNLDRIENLRDFNAPLVPPRPADSSAAMIAANGLLLLSQGELSLQPPNKTGSDYYTSAAIQVGRPFPPVVRIPSL